MGICAIFQSPHNDNSRLFDGILIRYVTPYYNCRHSQFSASRRFHPQIKVALCTSFIRTIAWLDIPFQLHAKDRKVAESLQQPLRQNIGYLCIVLQHDAQGVVVA